MSIESNAADITSFLCILFLANLAFSNAWQLKVRRVTSKYFVMMFFTILLSNVTDITFYAFYEQPGELAHTILLATNTILYLTEVTACWIALAFVLEAQGRRTPLLLALAVVPAAAVFVLMAVNWFDPVAFGITADGDVTHGPLYFATAAVAIAYVVAIVAAYLVGVRRENLLRFFPVWCVVVPAVFALFSDLVLGSISLAWFAVAIALDGVLAAFQKEITFRDTLTGLYNRLYLSQVRLGDTFSSATLADLDGFKSINDTYGHDAGDKALTEAAHVMEAAVGRTGLVFRYAGDEFLVLTKASSGRSSEEQERCMTQGFHALAEDTTAPYALSASFGSCEIGPANHDLDGILKAVDVSMYRSKAARYSSNGIDRRRS